VPHRHRHAPTQRRHARGRRGPGHHPQKELIERAYRLGEGLGLPVWCQDEAGPYQAIPQPGASWQPEGHPTCLPHEYVRGGTAKLLTLFRPATGEVRAEPVLSATNAVLHPWLMRELDAVLATCPPDPDSAAPGRRWSDWSYREDPFGFNTKLPPIRMLLILDNLAGHHTTTLVDWCHARGIWLLYTPIAGSWLNMAESVQRILVRRALDGHHPQDAPQVMDWLAQAVRGWNAAPTPFAWGGHRAARRARARERRHRLGGSGACTRRPLSRPRRSAACTCKGHAHVK
jgi:DDE superfamily endonuclease